jgi:hypothetical protein
MRAISLIDDRSATPLRNTIGRLLREAQSADFAVGHVRLGAIDLSSVELARVQRCRLLIDRLDIDMLADVAEIVSHGGPLVPNLAVLHRFALSGRIQLRSTGSLRWSPDFSILRGVPSSRTMPHGSVCLVGAHYFTRPVALDGVSLTCMLTDPEAIDIADLRFAELWERGHDVLPVVSDLLREILEIAGKAETCARRST